MGVTVFSPKKIKEILDKSVIGQDEAKKSLAVAVYNHYTRINSKDNNVDDKKFKDVVLEKSNVLLLGNTGTGKTFLIKTLAEILNVPYYIADATSLTEAGYVGDDVENVVTGLLVASDFDVDAAERGIICIDEIDKITKKSENVSLTRDVGGEGVQQGLLKIVEGSVVHVSPTFGRKHPQQELITVNTDNILFIGMGAFVGIEERIKERLNTSKIGFNTVNTKIDDDKNPLEYLTSEDLKKYGLIPELIGRFPVVTYTNPLTVDDLVRIMVEPKNSIVNQYKKMFYMEGTTLNFANEALNYIAENAYKNKTGARGLRSIMEKVLLDVMFENCGNGKKTVKITKKDVEKILEK